MTAKTRKHTKADVLKALQAFQRVCQPTPLELAQRRMADAKTQFTAAAEAAMRGDVDAPELTEAAMFEVEAAGAALAAVNAPQLELAADPIRDGEGGNVQQDC